MIISILAAARLQKEFHRGRWKSSNPKSLPEIDRLRPQNSEIGVDKGFFDRSKFTTFGCWFRECENKISSLFGRIIPTDWDSSNFRKLPSSTYHPPKTDLSNLAVFELDFTFPFLGGCYIDIPLKPRKWPVAASKQYCSWDMGVS